MCFVNCIFMKTLKTESDTFWPWKTIPWIYKPKTIRHFTIELSKRISFLSENICLYDFVLCCGIVLSYCTRMTHSTYTAEHHKCIAFLNEQHTKWPDRNLKNRSWTKHCSIRESDCLTPQHAKLQFCIKICNTPAFYEIKIFFFLPRN